MINEKFHLSFAPFVASCRNCYASDLINGIRTKSGNP